MEAKLLAMLLLCLEGTATDQTSSAVILNRPYDRYPNNRYSQPSSLEGLSETVQNQIEELRNMIAKGSAHGHSEQEIIDAMAHAISHWNTVPYTETNNKPELERRRSRGDSAVANPALYRAVLERRERLIMEALAQILAHYLHEQLHGTIHDAQTFKLLDPRVNEQFLPFIIIQYYHLYNCYPKGLSAKDMRKASEVIAKDQMEQIQRAAQSGPAAMRQQLHQFGGITYVPSDCKNKRDRSDALYLLALEPGNENVKELLLEELIEHLKKPAHATNRFSALSAEVKEAYLPHALKRFYLQEGKHPDGVTEEMLDTYDVSFSIEELNNNSIMPRLQGYDELNLIGKRISSLRGMDQLDPEFLERLRILKLGNNKLETLDGLPALPELEFLFLHKNQLSSLAGLDSEAMTPKLIGLYVPDNKFKKPIEKSELPGVRLIDMARNPLSSQNPESHND